MHSMMPNSAAAAAANDDDDDDDDIVSNVKMLRCPFIFLALHMFKT